MHTGYEGHTWHSTVGFLLACSTSCTSSTTVLVAVPLLRSRRRYYCAYAPSQIQLVFQIGEIPHSNLAVTPVSQ